MALDTLSQVVLHEARVLETRKEGRLSRGHVHLRLRHDRERHRSTGRAAHGTTTLNNQSEKKFNFDSSATVVSPRAGANCAPHPFHPEASCRIHRCALHTTL